MDSTQSMEKRIVLASQTAILYKRSKKNCARAFNIKRAPQNQTRYQYSGQFMSVFQ